MHLQHQFRLFALAWEPAASFCWGLKEGDCFCWGISHFTLQINKQQRNWQEVMALWWAGLCLGRGQMRQHHFHSSTKSLFLATWPKEAEVEGWLAKHICRTVFHRKQCSSSADKFQWRTKADFVQCFENDALDLNLAFQCLKTRLGEWNLLSLSPLFKLAAWFSNQLYIYHMKGASKTPSNLQLNSHSLILQTTHKYIWDSSQGNNS